LVQLEPWVPHLVWRRLLRFIRRLLLLPRSVHLPAPRLVFKSLRSSHQCRLPH
jgi:hypothetical protein